MVAGFWMLQLQLFYPGLDSLENPSHHPCLLYFSLALATPELGPIPLLSKQQALGELDRLGGSFNCASQDLVRIGLVHPQESPAAFE